MEGAFPVAASVSPNQGDTARARTVFLHELRCYARDGRTLWAAGLTLVLLLAAVMSGWSYRRTLERERAAAKAEEVGRWLGQGQKNAHSAAHYGVYAFKPASPLSGIDQGVEPFLGVGVWLEAHHMNQFVHRPAQDGTAVSRFGELSAALALQVLSPLLVIVLGFDVFAAERERGTLRQLLSLGVHPGALVRGKLAALATVLGMIVGPAALGAALMMGRGGSEAVPAPFARVVLLAVVYAGYLGGWAFLTVAVSARARTSRGALVALFACWAFGCLAMPRAAADLAAWLRPVPSAAAFRNALESDMGPAHSSDRALARKERILKQYGVTRIEDLPIDWRGISLQEEEELNHPIFERHFGRLFDVYRAQDLVLQGAGFVSPLLAAQTLSHALTGTDFEHHRRFVFAAEEHRRVIQKLMNQEVTLHDREDRPNHLSGHEVWAKVPEFRYVGPALFEALSRCIAAGIVLALWVTATSWVASSFVRRMEP